MEITICVWALTRSIWQTRGFMMTDSYRTVQLMTEKTSGP